MDLLPGKHKRKGPDRRAPWSIFRSSCDRARLLVLAAVFAVQLPLFPQGTGSTVVVYSSPLSSGHVSPMLFGNFVELLDDVVPAMWAEMLNDRSFAGVTRAAEWSYYDGKPDFCDREWDRDISWAYDTSGPANGLHSARLNASAHRSARLAQSGLAVNRDMVYEFSGWFRAPAKANLAATVRLKTLLPTGDWLILASAKLPRFSTEWRKSTAQLASRGQTDRAVFELELEGEGQAWAGKLSLMPANNLKGWRVDIIRAIEEVDPSVLRWGGSTCDPGQYRWKQGVGDRDERVPFPNKVWGRIDSNDVGIDEFCQLCELTGAEPLICVSFSDGPQSARDLVEYCNADGQTTWGAKRAANGHPAPYRVKFWQLGNELSGDDENYLSQVGRFVTGMKQSDPHVRLMSSFPGHKLLERFGKDLACVCPHHYTPDFGGCDRELTELTRMIESTPDCGEVKIAVTEWNVTGGEWGLGRGKMLTLDCALLNARYLHVLMRHSDKVEIACRSNLANSYAGAIIETSPSGLLKRPSFYAMQLYAHHDKPIPLRIECSNPALDLFACAEPDNKSLCLFAINPGTKAEPIACRFEGFAGAVQPSGAEVLCDTLDAGQRDVMNHWEAPDRIHLVTAPPPSDPMTLRALSVTAVEYRVQ